MTLQEMFGLDGRTVVVTGASSGLGRRFAQVVDAAGANVVIAARRRERLDELAATLRNAHVVPADLTVAEDRQRLVDEALQAFGGVDVLVNNAGIGYKVAVEDESLDDFRNSIELNLTAVWHLSKLVAPTMIARGGGSVINVASMLGLVASSPVRQAHYTAAKGGVVNLTRELACQWARKSIRVNALCPGWFRSEMTAGMDDDASQSFIRAMSPIPRMGEAHELDAALLFLAGSGSTFYTGQSLTVDGGWTAR